MERDTVMPTPTGRPKVGENIRTPKGRLVGTVLRRTGGDSYSVELRMAATGRPQWVTEFEWWMRNNGWRIEVPAQASQALVMAVRAIRDLQIRTLTSRADTELMNPALLTLVDALVLTKTASPPSDAADRHTAKAALEFLSAEPTIEFDDLDLSCDYYSVLGGLRRDLAGGA